MFDSDEVLPFALRIVEGAELIQLGDDNGEFGASQVISNCLGKLDGYNILVAVTLKVYGCFNTDMVQNRKLPCIRAAALSAIDQLREHLESSQALSAKSTATATATAGEAPPSAPLQSVVLESRSQSQSQSKSIVNDPGDIMHFDSQMVFTEMLLGDTPKRAQTPSSKVDSLAVSPATVGNQGKPSSKASKGVSKPKSAPKLPKGGLGVR